MATPEDELRIAEEELDTAKRALEAASAELKRQLAILGA